MYILLKNADFSGCGLGQILTITDEVKDFAANFGYGESNLEAIQIFMNSMGYGIADSMWSRMHLLLLPVLSTTVRQAVTNAINNTFSAQGGFISTIEPNISIKNRGIALTEYFTLDKRTPSHEINSATAESNFAFSYHVDSASSPNAVIGTLGRVGDGHIGLSNGVYGYNGLTSLPVPAGLFYALLGDMTTKITAYGDTSSVDFILTSTPTKKLVGQSNWLLTHNNNTNTYLSQQNKDYPVYAMGHGDLTAEEVPLFRAAIKTLVDSVL